MSITGFDLIAFDADDTLWANETLYRNVEALFRQLLAGYGITSVEPMMHANEIRNLQYYGYGIKGFILSLIETAIELTAGRITGGDIAQILAWGKQMQTAPMELVEHAQDVVARLAETYRLMLISKGDLFDQEAKLARSGLGRYFRDVEILSEKTQESYAAILSRYHIAPQRFLMVGNSLKSDILPVIAIGGQAIYVPSPLTWAHEAMESLPGNDKGYVEVEHLGLVLDVIERRGYS